MTDKYLHEAHFDFSGGAQQGVGHLLTADNEVDAVENGEYVRIGPVTKCKGYSQRGSDVATNYEILGLVAAYKASDGTLKQIAVADGASNSDAYTYNPVTDEWTPHVLSLSTGAKAEFESFLDGFFMVNFEDTTRFNNLAAWSTTTNVTNAPKAKYIKLFDARLYLAYVVDSGTTFPSRVIYSDLPSGSPLTLTWNNTVNYFDVDPDNGDILKGLEVNNSRLLIFKENSLYAYDTNSLTQLPGSPGTVSQRSIKTVLGWTFYLTPQGEIWATTGGPAKLMSRQIKDLLEGVSTKNLERACAFTQGDHYYLYVGDVDNSEKGISIPNCLIDLNVAMNNYSWRSLENEFTVFSKYRDDRSTVTYDDATITYNDANTTYNGIISTEQKIYGGSTLGEVFQMNNGNTCDGKAISFSVTTRDYYLTSPSYYKLLQKIIVYVAPAGKGITIQFKMDDKDWQTLGRVDKEQKELMFPAGSRCQRVKFRVIEKSSGGQFDFEGFDIFYTVETLEE